MKFFKHKKPDISRSDDIDILADIDDIAGIAVDKPKKKKHSIFWEAFRINLFTLLTLVFLWKFIDALDILNPFDQFIDNFDYTDLIYSELSTKANMPDTNIFIVNIGNLNRRELADEIRTLQQFEPKIIAIDAVFLDRRGLARDSILNAAGNVVEQLSAKHPNAAKANLLRQIDTLCASIILFDDVFAGRSLFPKLHDDVNLLLQQKNDFTDMQQIFILKGLIADADFCNQEMESDSLLKAALNEKNNIVLGAMGHYGQNDTILNIEFTNPYFQMFPHPTGHLEFKTDAQTIREFDKFIRLYHQNGDTTTLNSFALEIVRQIDYDRFLAFAQRKKPLAFTQREMQTEVINYRKGQKPFIDFDFEDITPDNRDLEILKDKIVLMGYVRMFRNAPQDTIDSHFSPLQRSQYGYADIKGIEIHAHALSMIMSGKFVDKLPQWVNYLIAFIVTQLFLCWLVYFYVNGAKLFDILSKPIQFLLIVLVVWATYIFFDILNVKIDMLSTALALILCIEILYLYEEFLELFKISTYLTQNFNYEKDENKILRLFGRLIGSGRGSTRTTK